MAGRRLREFLGEKAKKQGVSQVVLGGLANDYSGYVTTPEEYRFQHYEGAHTLYGEKTLAIYLNRYAELLDQLSRGELESETPPVFFKPMRDALHPASIDGLGIAEYPGKVLRQPPESIKAGDPIEVVFRSGLPSRFVDPNLNMVSLEYREGKDWTAVPIPLSSKLSWRRESGACVLCSQLFLKISGIVKKGEYRVRHQGIWSFPLKKRPYQESTRVFEIY